jgi:4-hydroxyphenylpyruvate dioxygenase-like putative hemolysin
MNLPTLISKYIELTPTFSYIKKKFFNNNIQIDHIAHRSFNYKPLVDFYIRNSFYKMNDIYLFPNMNVTATWLKSNDYRVFVSQYEGKQQFNINTYDDYLQIKLKNDYVAWTLLHQNDINHIAITVTDIQEIINKIKMDGTIQLNNEDQPITISKDGNLLQASTIADKILYKFPDNSSHLVPYSFVEFVERKNGRDGFESANAAQIFKSTNL